MGDLHTTGLVFLATFFLHVRCCPKSPKKKKGSSSQLFWNFFRAALKLTSMSHTPKKWKLPPNVETHLVLLESHGMLVAGQAPKVRVSRYTTCSEMFVSKGHHIPIDESCSPYFPGFNISVSVLYIYITIIGVACPRPTTRNRQLALLLFSRVGWKVSYSRPLL